MKFVLILSAYLMLYGHTPAFGEEPLRDREAKMLSMLKSLDGAVLEALVGGRSATKDNIEYARDHFAAALEAVKAHVSLLTKKDGDVLGEKMREIYLKRLQVFQDLLEDEQKRLN